MDIRSAFGVKEGEATVYSGVAVFEPSIFDWIPAEGPSSIIDALLAAMREGEFVGGMMSREGFWIDLGTPSAYLEAHRLLLDPMLRPNYVVENAWPQSIHPSARVDPSVQLEGMVAVGPGAVIGEGAFVSDSILWPNAVIAPGARIKGCVVGGVRSIGGNHEEEVLS